MKLPQIDLSKEGMQEFLLHHAEKLVLAIAIIGTGLFFYLGFQTKSYDKTTPKQLTGLATSAQNYVQSDTSWESIKDFRKGDDEATKRLQEAASRSITSEKLIGGVLNIRARSLEKRLDPELYTVEKLTAVAVTAPVLRNIRKNSNDVKYKLPIASLPLASAADIDEEDDDDGRGGLGGGSVGGGEDFGQGDDDKKKKKKQDPDQIILGTELPDYLRQLIVGVRPDKLNAVNPNAFEVQIRNMVMVTGVINIKKQWAEFEKSLIGRQGYWAKRDRPIYQLIEIERMEKPPGGEWTNKWVNKTDEIINLQRQTIFPDPSKGAPEVIHPDYYDAKLTQPIPPFTMMDYRKELFQSPEFAALGIPHRNLKPEPPVEKTEFVDVPTGDKNKGNEFRRNEFSSNKNDPADKSEQGRLGEGEEEDTSETDNDQPILGSDVTAYEAVAKSTRKPPVNYKLVRFFDTNVYPDYSYRYRVRFWISDPNNEDPSGDFGEAAGKSADDAASRGLGSAMGELGGDGDEGGGGGGDGEEEDNSPRVEVKDSMLAESVRVRLAREKARKNDELPVLGGKKQKHYEYMRVTNPNWENAASVEVTVKPTKARFYAGGVRSGKLLRIGDNVVPDGEPVAELVTAELSETYGTSVPAHKLVRRSDVLNFKADAHLLHPVDWNRVLKAEDHEFKTDAMVVDMMGGRELKGISGTNSASRAAMQYSTPSEVLIMDFENGRFHVQNDVEDRQGYRMSLFLDDEIAEMGKRKKAKPESEDPGGGDF